MKSYRKKLKTRVSRTALKKEVGELSLSIADRKEGVRLLQLEIARFVDEVKRMQRDIQTWRIAAFGIEDANERSKVNATIQKAEKRLGDALFKLAAYRSRNRRAAADYQDLERRIVSVRKALGM